MEYLCEILLGNDVIGTAAVSRAGLYYHICCNCMLSGKVIFKIVAECDNKSESLGICVPKGDSFGLEKKVPVKKLGEGIIKFRAVPNHPNMHERFIPIKPEEPFAYIERLQKSHLQKRENILGVVLEGE